MKNFAKIIMFGMFSIALPCLADVVSPAYVDSKSYRFEANNIAGDSHIRGGSHICICKEDYIAPDVPEPTLISKLIQSVFEMTYRRFFCAIIYLVIVESLLISLLIIIFNGISRRKNDALKSSVQQSFMKKNKKSLIIAIIVIAVLNLIVMHIGLFMYPSYKAHLANIEQMREEIKKGGTPCLSGKHEFVTMRSDSSSRLERCKKCYLKKEYSDGRGPHECKCGLWCEFWQ